MTLGMLFSYLRSTLSFSLLSVTLHFSRFVHTPQTIFTIFTISADLMVSHGQ